MEHKNIEDSEKLQEVLNHLGLTANALANKLSVSHGSIYHILNGVNSLSIGMVDRIVRNIPNVNYNFLKKGHLPVLLSDKEVQNQMNLFNIASPKDNQVDFLKRIAEIPDRLDEIESMIKYIKEKLN